MKIKRKCTVLGCTDVHYAKGFCVIHYFRFVRTGNTDGTKRRAPGTGSITRLGYMRTTINGVQKSEHVWVAEKALGKQLPCKAEVHHIDGNKGNNFPSNLVVCPDHAYHLLLEARTRALEGSGNANYKKCWICKKWDDPKNLRIRSGDCCHPDCVRLHHRKYMRDWNKRRVSLNSAP